MSCVYKLIGKVLVRRMIKVLNKVVGENQNGFVEGSQITNTLLIANEVVGELLHKKRDEVLCKLDMEKSNDHVNWGFIDHMLARINFGITW